MISTINHRIRRTLKKKQWSKIIQHVIESNSILQAKQSNLDYLGWKIGLPDGKGVQVYKDGSIYKGDRKGDKQTGKGKLTCIDGDVYKGDLIDGIFEGKGVWKNKNGVKYEGEVYKYYCLRLSGKMTRNMDTEQKFGQMVQNTKVSLSKIKRTDKDYCTSQMDPYMKVYQ